MSDTRFIRLRVMRGGSGGTDRLFNLRHIMSIQPASCSIMLHGSNAVLTVSRESMQRLVDAVEGRGSLLGRILHRHHH